MYKSTAKSPRWSGIAAVSALALTAFTSSAIAEDMVTIDLDFPKAMFVGTPVKAKRPNLETPDPKKVIKQIKVPKGVTNVAEEKEITSSDPEPIIGDLEMITDTDKDGADGSYVELGPGVQWIQVDLEDEAEIYAIAVWHFHKNARAYDDVVIQVSSDKDFKSGVETVFNNDHDNSSKLGKGSDPAWIETNHGRVIKVDGKKGQFVRFYSNGNTANEMNHYTEIEVYGK